MNKYCTSISAVIVANTSCLCRGNSSRLLYFYLPWPFFSLAIPKPTKVQFNSQRFSRVACNGQLRSFHVLEGYSEKESAKKVSIMKFLGRMENKGITANSNTFCWILDDAVKYRRYDDCKMLHGKILKMGLGNDRVLCEKFMDVYHLSGDLLSVSKSFSSIDAPNVLSFNRLFAIYISGKMAHKVLFVFSKMVKESVNPSEVTFAYVLRSCVSNNSNIQMISQIHSKMIAHGFGYIPDAGNHLIGLYAKNGLIKSASNVFHTMLLRNSASWLAMMSGYSQNKHENDALQLFAKMRQSGFLLTPYVFSSVLSACSKAKFFAISQQLHGLTIKSEFAAEIYVCNALITLYSNMGDFPSAEKLFRRLPNRDDVSYNSLIAGLSQQGYGVRALNLFDKMQRDCFKPNCVTVASALSACASSGALPKGEQLHALVVKSGMLADVIIEGSLLYLYVKTSNVGTAHRLFRSAQSKNAVLYNVMFVAFGLLEDLNSCYHLFTEMQMDGLVPNQFTYPSILRTCTAVGNLDFGEQIHTHVVKMGLQLNSYVCSVLIDMYAKLGNLDAAMRILERVCGKDVVSWTAMIAGYVQHGLFAEGLYLFDKMLLRGIDSDNIGFSSAISACAGLKAMNLGLQVHCCSVACGYSEDLSIGSALVSLYAKCGKKEEAYKAFHTTDRKDSASWNGLISGFTQSGLYEEALKVMAQMNSAFVQPNFFTLGSSLSAAANLGNINQGKQIHAIVMKKGFSSETEICNTLISLYSKCGFLSNAEREFSEMSDRSDVSWNAMISAYSQHGHGTKAVKLFEDMKLSKNTPNHATFVGILSACSHAGLVEDGLRYINSMENMYSLKPKVEHYVCVVDLLARAGFLSRAMEFIKEIPIEVDSILWRTLLSGCAIHKNKEIGELCARRLLSLQPEDSATYVLLSNLYEVTGNWRRRDRARKMMKERGIKKEPGCSWIEVKSSVHSLYVGDKLHPKGDEIYEYLGELNEGVSEIGYEEDGISFWREAAEKGTDRTECS